MKRPSTLAALLFATTVSGTAGAEEAFAAVQRLAADERAAAADELAGYLRDPTARVRAAAARALGRRKAMEHAAGLGLALGDSDSDVRESSLEALRSLAAELGCGGALVAARGKAPAGARARLVPVLAQCPEPEARAAWGGGLGDPDQGVRAAADRSLRLAPSDAAGAAVAACLDATADAERLECARFAQELKLAAALPKLASLATYDIGAPDVRAAAKAAVRAMLEEIDAPTVAQRARESTDRNERTAALQILALVPGDRSYVALTHGLQDPDEYVRQVAAAGLGEFGDLRGVGPLAKALDAPANKRIRKTIQRSLDRLTKGPPQR